MRFDIIIIISFVLYPIPVALSDTIQVPADQPTIQAGIDAAVNGDTVLVAPGTYEEILFFNGKAIAVKSEQGPHATVIDGKGDIRVVSFENNEGPDSLIEGFTIRNAKGSLIDGGGIYCDQASPTIRNNIITENSCHIGGGIICYTGSPEIIGNIITNNESIDWSAGICCYYSSPNIADNIISENKSELGGGISCSWDSSPTITGNIVSNNIASWGGGVFLLEGTSVIANNIVYANRANHEGGAFYCEGELVAMINNTVVDNEAEFGGGVYFERSTAVVTNTILWNNFARIGPEILLGDEKKASYLAIDHSNLKGGKTSIYIDPGSVLEWGIGMIDSDPLFVDVDSGDCHLTFSSPCRASGNNAVQGLPAYDFEGDPRICHCTVDIGADECHTHLYYTGVSTPGGEIEGKLIGLPGAYPTGLWFGLAGVIDPPVQTKYGLWHLNHPWVQVWLMPPVPASGVLIIPARIPLYPPPYDIPLQGLAGLNSDSLTNVCVLKVR